MGFVLDENVLVHNVRTNREDFTKFENFDFADKLILMGKKLQPREKLNLVKKNNNQKCKSLTKK